MSNVININEKFKLFSDLWNPRIICGLNDYHLKLVKVKGDFVWHKHDETDELFFVIKGNLKIDLKDETISLSDGEMFVIPKGVEHRPHSENVCEVLLMEPAGTVNTGDAGGDLTRPELEWI